MKEMKKYKRVHIEGLLRTLPHIKNICSGQKHERWRKAIDEATQASAMDRFVYYTFFKQTGNRIFSHCLLSYIFICKYYDRHFISDHIQYLFLLIETTLSYFIDMSEYRSMLWRTLKLRIQLNNIWIIGCLPGVAKQPN